MNNDDEKKPINLCDHPPAEQLSDLWCSTCRMLKLAGREIQAPAVTTSADVIRSLLRHVTPHKSPDVAAAELLGGKVQGVYRCGHCNCESALGDDGSTTTMRPGTFPIDGRSIEAHHAKAFVVQPWAYFQPKRLTVTSDAEPGTVRLIAAHCGMVGGFTSPHGIPIEALQPCSACAGDHDAAADAEAAVMALPTFVPGQLVELVFRNDGDRVVQLHGAHFSGVYL